MLSLRRVRRSRARLLGVLVLVIGLFTTAGIGTGWWWTDLHSRRLAHRLADGAMQEWAAEGRQQTGPGRPGSGQPGQPGPAEPLDMPAGIGGQVIAVVRAARLGADWRMPVQQGTGTQVLREGLGLYDGSPVPGSRGNVAMAGHRTTWGAPLKHLNRMRPGDLITVWTARGRFDYRVVSTGVTLPTDTSVIQPAAAHGTAMLTLTTCNPEFSARQRLFIHAVLTSSVKSAYSTGISPRG